MNLFQQVKTFWQEKIQPRLNAFVGMILISVICLASLFLQYFSRADAVSFTTIAGAVIVPFQNGVNAIGSLIYNSEQEKISLQEAKEEIENLKKENELLKAQIWDSSSLEIENSELRELLEAKKRYADYEMTYAQVIGQNGANAFYRLTINKGSLDGIKVNMNVVNADGLVGIVTQVGLNYSIVTTIVEDNMSVSAMTKNGHEKCVVTGSVSKEGLGKMVLTNVSDSINFNKDSSLVTSTISDKYLPNIPIGTAFDMKQNIDGITQSGYLTTAVDFTNINHVLVVTTMLEELKEE